MPWVAVVYLTQLSRRRETNVIDGIIAPFQGANLYGVRSQGVALSAFALCPGLFYVTPSRKYSAHREQHAEVIGIVISDQQRFAEDRLARAVWNLCQ